MPNLCKGDVARELDSVFDAISSPKALKLPMKDRDSNVDGENLGRARITPLIISCDKSNEICLQYLVDKLVAYSKPNDLEVNTKNSRCLEICDLIGDPLIDVSDGENRNTAVHHAAMAGFSSSIQLIHHICIHNSSDSSYHALGSVRNSHGDTPLMMAASAGHVEFIKQWYQLVTIPEEEGADAKTLTEKANSILCYKNDSDDTCLSLACCDGQQEVIEFLLSSCDIPIEAEQVAKCKQSLQQMTSALRNRPSLFEQHKEKIETMLRCVVTIEAAQNRKAEAIAQELLAKESSDLRTKNPRKSKKKKGPPAKNKTIEGIKEEKPEKATIEPNMATRKTLDKEDADENDVCLTTLPDGTVAVRVQGEALESDDSATNGTRRLQSPTANQQSANDMFRQRFGERGDIISSEVDSVMDALLLDVSMLLYTPHGMALNLSPSQLDAIQGILEKQMGAVKEAREIQLRMHQP